MNLNASVNKCHAIIIKKMKPGRVSLVLCTIGRVKEVELFLTSVSKQIIKPYELIIIDQNKDDCLIKTIRYWETKLPIRYYKVNFKGVCRARNFGCELIKGDFVGFPDDDCRYMPNTISDVVLFFGKNKECYSVIGSKENSFNNTRAKVIENVLDIFISKAETSNIFIRKEIAMIMKPNIFDESIGPGSEGPYSSNDETDFLIRILRKKLIIVHEPKIKIIHHSSEGSLKKTFEYALSRYNLISKHKLGLFYYIINIIQPLTSLIKKPTIKNILYANAKILGRSGLPLIWMRLIK